jgi:LPXTG-site transpeptidase (sortase) family protein
MSNLIGKVILTAVILGGVYVLMNSDYFWQQANFRLIKPQVEQTQQNRQTGEDQSIKSVQLSANTLSIPSLAINVPILYPNGNTENDFQIALRDGVVHYPGTAAVGQPGNVYIFGHSSDYAWAKGDYKTAFALLPQAKIGADIFLSDTEGRTHRYIVRETFVAAKTDVQLLDQGDRSKSMLTLQTSYPLGTALKRYIVRAELVQD